MCPHNYFSVIKCGPLRQPSGWNTLIASCNSVTQWKRCYVRAIKGNQGKKKAKNWSYFIWENASRSMLSSAVTSPELPRRPVRAVRQVPAGRISRLVVWLKMQTNWLGKHSWGNNPKSAGSRSCAFRPRSAPRFLSDLCAWVFSEEG